MPDNIDANPWPLQGEERDRVLGSLSRVGPQKLVGYLPLNTILVVLELTPQLVENEASRKGLVAIQLDAEDCCIGSGAIYVYDSENLSKFLSAVSPTLIANGWPLEPEQFVRAIAATWVNRGNPVFPIISDAFGNSRD